ncbi:GntR family transcriptional regulator [Oleispirillum naphthae]|uniref:GntR family transcriptional regulator n=1 Tax=Oleispirillum naphthae TaxID=2838853 RepID=UPI0030822456
MKSMQPKPVVRQSIENRAADSLREFILSGRVRPGTRLTEIALADQIGVARATLRTGLHRLAGEGIVVQIPYTGWQVTELTETDVWELWTLRAGLESLAARLAAQSGDAPSRAAVARAYEALLAACAKERLKQVNACDFALHRSIVEAAGHARLAGQYRLVEQQVRLFIATSNTCVAEGMDDIVAQHRAVAEAVLSGDAEAAARQAWHHNESEGMRLVAWLRRKAGH